MVTSTSLLTNDAGPAVSRQQQPAGAAVTDANSSSGSPDPLAASSGFSSRAAAPQGPGQVVRLTSSSQSLPATIISSSQMMTTTNDTTVASSSSAIASPPQALPSYRQITGRSGNNEAATSSSTSASPHHPHSPGYHHHHHLHQSPHPSVAQQQQQQQQQQRPLNSSLPDILHSHLGPSLRQNQHRQNRDRQQRPRSHGPGGEGGGGGGNRSGQHGGGGGRHNHRPRGNRRARTLSTSSAQAQEGGGSSCKEPCVKCVVTVTSFRWVLVVLSILGVCCVVSGIILAALHAVGNSFLFLAIMFIGLGVLLVVVVAVGWKCTPRGHEPLHALFRIGQFQNRRTTRERRHRRHRNRDGNWFGGVLYPEFQYRRPPPSYAASMQDYNNQSLQELRTSGALSSGNIDSGSLPSSPPPSYRSRTSTLHSGIHSSGQTGELPNSRPPTYRSRAPSRRPSLPRDERRELDQGADVAVADVAFTGPASTEENTNAQNGNDVFTVSSSTQPSVVSESSSPQTYSVLQAPMHTHVVDVEDAQNSTLTQAQTMQLEARASYESESSTTGHVSLQEASSSVQNRTFNPNSTSASSHSQLSESIPMSSSSSSDAVVTAVSSTTGAPSLHQRMKSQDREMLEKALQSLDSQIQSEEEGGHVNHGATLGDSEHFDTHL